MPTSDNPSEYYPIYGPLSARIDVGPPVASETGLSAHVDVSAPPPVGLSTHVDVGPAPSEIGLSASIDVGPPFAFSAFIDVKRSEGFSALLDVAPPPVTSGSSGGGGGASLIRTINYLGGRILTVGSYDGLFAGYGLSGGGNVDSGGGGGGHHIGQAKFGLVNVSIPTRCYVSWQATAIPRIALTSISIGFVQGEYCYQIRPHTFDTSPRGESGLNHLLWSQEVGLSGSLEIPQSYLYTGTQFNTGLLVVFFGTGAPGTGAAMCGVDVTLINARNTEWNAPPTNKGGEPISSTIDWVSFPLPSLSMSSGPSPDPSPDVSGSGRWDYDMPAKKGVILEYVETHINQSGGPTTPITYKAAQLNAYYSQSYVPTTFSNLPASYCPRNVEWKWVNPGLFNPYQITLNVGGERCDQFPGDSNNLPDLFASVSGGLSTGTNGYDSYLGPTELHIHTDVSGVLQANQRGPSVPLVLPFGQYYRYYNNDPSLFSYTDSAHLPPNNMGSIYYGPVANTTPGDYKGISVSVSGTRWIGIIDNPNYTSGSGGGGGCTFDPHLSPGNTTNFDCAGGGFCVQVNTQSGCGYTVVINQGSSGGTWIHGDTGTGTGPGGWCFTVDRNTTGHSRTGTVTIAGTVFTVTQSVCPCSYKINPLEVHYNCAPHDGSVGVDTQEDCEWSATSDASWLHITAGASGTGPGTVHYHVDANNTGVQRIGHIFVAGYTHTVTQEYCGKGGVCSLRDYSHRLFVFYIQSTVTGVLAVNRYENNDKDANVVTIDNGRCAAPSFWLAEDTQGGSYLRDKAPRMAFSRDHGKTWDTMDIPKAYTYKGQTSAEYSGIYYVLGWHEHDAAVEGSPGTGWYIHVGKHKDAGTLVWNSEDGETNGDPVLVTEGGDGSGHVRARQDGVLEFVRGPGAGLLWCRNMDLTGNGDWTSS